MSKIVTDTLEGKTSATSITLPTTTNIGSTPLVSASANSMTIKGEGSAVTNIQQGLAKSWTHFNGSSFGSRDDFNTSSLTDAGTGLYTFAITNNMGNANYTLTTNGTRANDQHVGCYYYDNSTSQAKFFTMDFTSNNYEDTDTVMGVIHGDLA